MNLEKTSQVVSIGTMIAAIIIMVVVAVVVLKRRAENEELEELNESNREKMDELLNYQLDLYRNAEKKGLKAENSPN